MTLRLDHETKSMRITHYLRRFALAEGGVVRAVLDICKLLAARGHEMTILTCHDDDVPPVWGRGEHGVPHVVRIPEPAGILGRFTRAQLAAVAPHLAATDVLHLHGCWELENSQLAAVARRRGLPYVISLHGMLDDWCMRQKRLKKRLFLAAGGRRTLEQAAVVHCTATAEQEQSRKWYPQTTGMVAPLVFDTTEYADLPGPGLADAAFGPGGTGAVRPDVPLVLFLSRIHPKKGVDVLVDALGLVAGRGIACQAVIAGAGEEAYVSAIRRRIDALGIRDLVHLVGLVTGQTKVSLYERADMLAIPTSQENFGFVFLESLACGTPVITTRGVDIWPALVASQGGVIVDRTADAFADAIARLIADRETARRMGAAGRSNVMERFAGSEVVVAFETMYVRAATGCRAVRV